MKTVFSKKSSIFLAAQLMYGASVCAMHKVELEVPTTAHEIAQNIAEKVPTKSLLSIAAKKAATIALLDTFSNAVVSIAGDYFGSQEKGQLTAAMVSAYMLTQLKALESYRNGNLSIKDILPIDIVMNADGITTKPIVSGLLTIAGLAYVYGAEYNIPPQLAFAAMVALKLALFKNTGEAIAYNMSSHISSLILGRLYDYVGRNANIDSIWSYAKNLVGKFYR